MVAALLLAGVGLAGCTRSPVRSPASVYAQPQRDVVLHGVFLTLPFGWSTAAPRGCRPLPEHTITVFSGARWVSSCPSQIGPVKPVEAMTLNELFGPYGGAFWAGTQVIWRGQSAWVEQQTASGAEIPACLPGNGSCQPSQDPAQPLTTTLTLPWMNVAVVIINATPAQTADLLRLVRVHPGSGLGVPAGATSMTLRRADSPRVWTTRSQLLIGQTLAALRRLPLVPVGAACGPTLGLQPVSTRFTITFTGPGGATTVEVLDQPCNQVTSGLGTAAQGDAPLRAALAQDLQAAS